MVLVRISSDDVKYNVVIKMDQQEDGRYHVTTDLENMQDDEQPNENTDLGEVGAIASFFMQSLYSTANKEEDGAQEEQVQEQQQPEQ